MKKIIFFFSIVTLWVNFEALGQQAEQDFDVAVVIPRYTIANLPNASTLLADKLRQALSVNGRVSFLGSKSNEDIGGSESDYCFVMIPVITEISRNITSSPPILNTIELNVTLYIAGYDVSSTFGTYSFTIKGVGSSYEKSYINAIKMINPESGKIQEYIVSTKNKIRKYYTENCDYLMNEAESIALRTSINENGYNSFMKSINILTQISKINPKCYSEASSKVQEIYERYRKFACSYYLTMAKIQWVARKSGEMERTDDKSQEQKSVFFYLRKIPPSPYCERELFDFLKEIEGNNIKFENMSFDIAKFRDSTSASIEKQRLANQSKSIDASILNNIGLNSRKEAVNFIFNEERKEMLRKE